MKRTYPEWKSITAYDLKSLQDTTEFWETLHADIDMHRFIAARILDVYEPDVTKEEREQHKHYTFYIRYGAFGKIPDAVLSSYKKHFPSLVKLGQTLQAKRKRKSLAR